MFTSKTYLSVRTGESARCHTSQPEAVFHINGTLLDFILISRPTSLTHLTAPYLADGVSQNDILRHHRTCYRSFMSVYVGMNTAKTGRLCWL